MKVLVTGACGLIGYNTCHYYWSLGDEVWGIDNLARSQLLGHKVGDERAYFNWRALDKMGVELICKDIRFEETFQNLPAEGFDLIVHLAGQCGVPTSIENPREDFEVNAVGTFNVLEYVRKTGKGRVIYASTNKVYPLHGGWAKSSHSNKWEWSDSDWHRFGFPKNGELKHPNCFAGGRTPYGTSKYVGDLLMQEYHHTYGIPTACFRMSCIYGPNQFGFEEQGWATWFVIAALKKWPITIFGDGDQVRDMLYVKDVVRAYDAFARSDWCNHGVWNIGGGPNNTLSLRECLDFLHAELRTDLHVEFQDWRPSDQRIYTSDIRQLELDLGWKPNVGPTEGLRHVIDWVKKNKDIF
jgi:CDP-paratose 2-epimerase